MLIGALMVIVVLICQGSKFGVVTKKNEKKMTISVNSDFFFKDPLSHIYLHHSNYESFIWHEQPNYKLLLWSYITFQPPHVTERTAIMLLYVNIVLNLYFFFFYFLLVTRNTFSMICHQMTFELKATLLSFCISLMYVDPFSRYPFINSNMLYLLSLLSVASSFGLWTGSNTFPPVVPVNHSMLSFSILI